VSKADELFNAAFWFRRGAFMFDRFPSRRIRPANAFAAWAALWCVGFTPASSKGAEPFEPVGGEFQVNTYTSRRQQVPSLAALPAGGFVVVWESDGSFGTDSGSSLDDPSVQGQRYLSDGSKLGAQFQVNTYTTSWQYHASVASDTDGDFVVVWMSEGSSGTDTSSLSIQGQRYASDGSRSGAEFQVNSYTTSGQNWPSVAVSPDGGFVVVWDSIGSPGTDTNMYSSSVQGQRYASDGSTLGAQFQVNTYTTGYQDHPSVAMDSAGNFTVVWQSVPILYLFSYDIKGQRYASDGSPRGTEFQINTYTTGDQTWPAVATDSGGSFVVVWTSAGSPGTDTSGNSIQGQRFDSNGSKQGSQFQVNTYTTSDQFLFRSLAMKSDGSFVVAWLSYGSSGTDASDLSVQGQRFAADGSREEAQFQVNTFTTSYQTRPDVAMLAGGGFVVAWDSWGSSGTDSDYTSIQAQRYQTVAAVPALSSSLRFALAVLLVLGAGVALRFGAPRV
jgi:hypothetical protein